MADLKPCPFCGGKAAFVPRAVNIVLQKDPSDPKFGVSVICGRCSSESPNMVDEEHAAAKWNTRMTLSPDQREALRQKVMAEMTRRMPIISKRFNDWRDWPGTWAFADVAVAALQDELARGVALPGKEQPNG
jgi:Lar family restriction alleviation protein